MRDGHCFKPVGFKTPHRAEKPPRCNGSRCVQCSHTMTPSHRWGSETSTSYDPVGITPHSCGGQCKDLTISADLVLRAEMFRINTLQPRLTGGEVMASVLTSACCCGPTVTTHYRASHLPTQQQLVGDNKRTYLPTLPKSAATSVTPLRVDSAGEICRLFADGRRKWGDARKRARLEIAQPFTWARSSDGQ